MVLGGESMHEERKQTMGIGQLAKLAGMSPRTLRHYESIGILNPERAANGYRIYDAQDAKELARIQTLKQCGMPLRIIRRLLHDPDVDILSALREHLRTLRAQGESLEMAVKRTQDAIEALERIEPMEAKDAFEELKEQGLRDFEATYGAEARERYGDEAIEAANERMMALTQDEWEAKELLEEGIKVQLRIARATGDPTGADAQELARMHERWIAMHWGGGYQPEAYVALVEGYLADPRFVKYYDSAAGEGATEFLVASVRAAKGA